MSPFGRRDPVLTAGVLLGVGMGGFFDGILFHQILQVHNMLSAVYPPDSLVNVETTMFWDGLFHAFTWATTAFGIALLWHGLTHSDRPAPSARTFVGTLLLGWGLFNLLEGLVDHHLLDLHHVVERYGRTGWDYGFLASGVVMIATGVMLSYEHGRRP